MAAAFRERIVGKALEIGLSRVQGNTLYNDIVDMLVNTLKDNGIVKISGLGTFKIRTNKPRIIKSSLINKGKPTKTSESKSIRFKVSNVLKKLLNGK